MLYELSGDWRRSLTWRGRFAPVTNAVNYYSEDEEVLANGDGTEASVGRFVQDEAVQSVTSVKPSLLVDYNQNDFGSNNMNKRLFLCLLSIKSILFARRCGMLTVPIDTIKWL